VSGADWPTHRGNNARSGVSAERIGPTLSLHWTVKPMHPPKPAWPRPSEERHRMAFDRAYYTTSAKGVVYFGSSVDNTVTALDAATGKTRWAFHTGGPVRFAPSIWQDRVYAGSDDGYVYCLSATDGKLVWKHRPGPSDEKIIGNGRMISVWPIRTSVLVEDGVVYFAAGVFPYEGIYVCAVKADDGSVVWKNGTFGDKAHELTFGGITPQGYLTASKRNLYVPAGRAMPVAFDRKTGQFRYICSAGGKTGGSWALVSHGELIAGVDHSGTPAKVAYEERTGKRKGDAFAWFPGIDMVVSPEATYILTEEGVYAIDRAKYLAAGKARQARAKDKKRREGTVASLRKQLRKADAKKRKALEKRIDQEAKALSALAEADQKARDAVYRWHHVGKNLCSLVLSGDVVFVGGDGVATALDAGDGKVLWRGAVDGRGEGLAPANGRLCVSTDRGTIHCFASASAPKPEVHQRSINAMPYPKDKLTGVYEAAVRRIVKETGVKKGYCLVLGCGEGRLAYELARQTELKLIGLERDPKKVAHARKRLDATGMLGTRIVVEPWALSTLPDYFANLIVSEEMLSVGKMSFPPREMYRVLRPFGGAVYFGRPKALLGPAEQVESELLADYLKKAGMGKPTVSREDGFWSRAIRGKLKGAGGWRQLYGGPHNTACSDDQLASAPFGVLWFGEPGPESMVERHARAEAPVAINGRLFVQGEEVVTGVDAYNGTVLWKRQIPGAVRVRVDVDGGNLAANENALFVAAEDKCHHLDPATGKTVRVYDLPPSPRGEPRRWGYVACTDKTLFGSAATPLQNEYGAIWKALVEDGAWKPIDEIPPQYVQALMRCKAQYPVPNRLARAGLQRAGMLWRLIARYPHWGNQPSPKGALTDKMMLSDSVFALDPATGKHRWVYRGKGIPHITITIADGTVYLIENELTAEQKAAARTEKHALIKKGVHEVGDEAKLGKGIEDIRLVVALDAATGKQKWAKPIDLTGCGGDKLGAAYRDGLLVFFGHFSNHDSRQFSTNGLRWRRITALDTTSQNVYWSKPLNYLRRPLIVGDTIIIEPRACELRTGEIKMRSHPISGEPVPWEFLRPGHSCGITSAAPNCIFYRSYCGAIYDMKSDWGLTLFGGIRPGCWLNLIAANGLLTMPEASSGCTCSFPLKCTVVLKPRDRQQYQPWRMFIAHGPKTPVRHLGVNFGAPGDQKDEAGRMWFGYPRPRAWYGVKLALYPQILDGMGYFCRDHRGASIEGTDRPWLFTSGCLGLVKFDLPLVDDVWSEGAGRYTLRLGFAAPRGDKASQRVFDVKLQDKMVLKDFDIVKAAGGSDRAVVKVLNGVEVAGNLKVELIPKAPKPTAAQAPVINYIEAVAEDVAQQVARTPKTDKSLPEGQAKSLLNAAKTKLGQKDLAGALRVYHEVFDGASSVPMRVAALEGMGAIGSPKSLGRIASYCKNVAPILRDYQDVPAELHSAATDVYTAIASNVASDDRPKALRMLRQAMKLTRSLAARQRTVGCFDRLGVQIDAEAAKQGYVTRWHVVGPFKWDAKTNTLDKAFVGEPAVDLGRTHKVGTKTVKWQPFTSEAPKVDLETLYGTPDGAAAYACAQVVLDKDQDLLLKIGSGDRFKCWFNGEEAGRCEKDRDWRADQSVTEVRGKKGVNTILLKVSNLRSDWAYSARLTDRKNKVVKFTLR